MVPILNPNSPLLGSETNEEDIYEIPDSAPSPAEQVEAVLRAVNNLPETYRLPLTLFHLDGLSYKKVAEFLDVSLSTVKWRLHQARKMLKKEMLNMLGEVFEERKPDGKFTEETMEKISVLVADDSPDMRDLLIKVLDDEGYNVYAAEDGREALERLIPGLACDLRFPMRWSVVASMSVGAMEHWEDGALELQCPNAPVPQHQTCLRLSACDTHRQAKGRQIGNIKPKPVLPLPKHNDNGI